MNGMWSNDSAGAKMPAGGKTPSGGKTPAAGPLGRARATVLATGLSAVVAALSLSLDSSPAHAQLPALYYDFENNVTRTIHENAVELAINAGSGPIARAGGIVIVSGVAGAGTFNGGAANGQAASGNTWSSVTVDPGAAATDYYQFVCNTTGLSQLSVTFDNQASATGPAVVGLLYSTDGATFFPTTIGPTGYLVFLPGGSTFDLSAIPAVDGQPLVTFRLYAYAGGAADRVGRSAFGSGGTFRIDNLTVRAIRFTQSATLLSSSAVGVGIRSGTAFNPTYSSLTVDGAGITVAANAASALSLSGSVTVQVGTLQLNNVFTASGTVAIASTGTLDLNNRTLTFAGTALTNDGLINGPMSLQPAARLSFVGSGAQTYNGVGGTGSVADPLPSVLMNKSAGNVTLGVGSSITTNAVLLIQGGSFINSGAITIGNSGPASSLVQIAQPLGVVQGGSFDSPPTFSLGPGGLYVYYGTEPGLRTTGFEIPPSRSVSGLGSDNPTHVALAGGPLQISGSLDLTRGTFAVGTGNTVTVGTGGTVAATTGNLASGTAGGTVAFASAGAVTGTVTFENVRLGTGIVHLGSSSTINASLDMATGSLATGFPPTYGPGATLIHSSGLALGEEWRTGTAQPGVPPNVRLLGGTVVFDPAAASTPRVLSGSLTIENGATLLLGSVAGGDLELKGDVLTSTTGTIDANNRTIIFSGTGPQTVGAGISILNLGTGRIANTGPGVTFDIPIELVILELTGTLCHTGPNVIHVRDAVLRTSGHVNGNLKRDVAGPNPSLRFDVGDATTYAPVVIDLHSVTTGGDLLVRTDPGDHPDIANSGLDASKSVNRWWSVRNTGTVFTDADVILQYDPSDVDVAANPPDFEAQKLDLALWIPTSGSPGPLSGQFTITAIPSFSDFAIAELETWTITATAGPGGLIAPSGAVTVNDGDTPMFTITPNVNFAIDDVLVDGGSVGAVSNYTFAPVTIDHTIEAFFVSTIAPNSVSAVSPGPCISVGNPCVTVPVVIARTEATHIRGYSVEIQLSADLELCVSPSASITQDTYLSAIGPTIFQVIDNGGGLYTVDAAILGSPCGQIAAAGTLFNVSVKKATGGSDGIGTVSIGVVLVRNCTNGALVAGAAGSASITIDTDAPNEIAGLAAAQVRSGNDADGTTKITLTWPPAEAGTTVEVYRAGFGFYPEYDDGGGTAPSPPSYPPGAPWALTGVTTSGATDEVTARDFYYYVAFVTDACGNVSAVSNRTGGTLNYHLGDVSDGFVAGQGDNQVGTPDISLLGANYGITGGAVTPVNYLDVGPTTDFSVHARPTTDNAIDFEDLILFAINFGTVSAPGEIEEGSGPSARGADELRVATEGLVAVGGTVAARIALLGSGRIQGLSIRLSWNAAVVEPVGLVAGRLAREGGIVLSPAAGTVDAALLGVRESGMAGEVDLATVSFRVIAAGDPRIAIAGAVARDARNREIGLDAIAGTMEARPVLTTLSPAAPNPFTRGTMLAFALATAGRVELAIYSVDGRRVKSLLRGTREAGFHSEAWDGTDDSGRRATAGVYYALFVEPDGNRQSRTITLIGP